MPKTTRLFIRSGMIFFALAMLLALFIEASRLGVLYAPLSGLVPVFWHFLLVGWITQIIIGVSLWMFPRDRSRTRRQEEVPAYAAFYGINTGLLLRAIAEPLSLVSPGTVWIQWGLLLSAGLQVIGGLAYVAAIWPRVKRVGRRRQGSGKGEES